MKIRGEEGWLAPASFTQISSPNSIFWTIQLRFKHCLRIVLEERGQAPDL